MKQPLKSSGRAIAAIFLGLVTLVLMPAKDAAASMLQLVPSSPTILAGQSTTISVLLTSTQNFTLEAADIEIAYDSTRFSVSNVQLGTLDSSASGFTLTAGFPASGTAGIGEVNAAIDTGTLGNSITPGQFGTVETFTLTALANAPTGAGTINLLAKALNAPNTTTAVYTDPGTGGAITLTPPPTNGFDAGIDTVVTVAGGTTVPEPSSLVLLGMGGILVSMVARSRNKARRSKTLTV